MAVDIVIYHNSECGTSRNTLGLIRNAGVEPHVVEYLKSPPSRAMLLQLAERTERGSISRADVAAVVLAAIDDERTIGKQWELIAGERTIAEAIDAALAD